VALLFELPAPDARARLQGLYDRLAARFSFGPARVRLSTRRLTGGEILYGSPHTITISAHMSAAERESTLRHEAAHAWAFALRGARVGHGALFRRLAASLGADRGPAPETEALRRHREKRQIVYLCDGCEERFRRMRPLRGARHCLRCWRAGRPSRLRRLPAV
jgi:predicted SprT family Zn-dependent metalloprotease